MQDYCIRHKIKHRNISQIHSPRASFPRFLYTILKVLGPVLPIKENDILDSIKELENTAKMISSENLASRKCKKHAMMEDVIEACHNNIVAWKKKDKSQPILLEGADDYIKTKQRWEILEIFSDK